MRKVKFFVKRMHGLKQRPGLVGIFAFYFCILVTTIKPNLYVLGWDTFPSYFHPFLNIFRTFFASWREYRGFGAPSDSEVTDIFRQLFFVILRPIVAEPLLDQIYIFLALFVGLLSIYFLSIHLFRHYFQERQSLLDISGFFAAFFYLFNLNTLATFYFPMTTYINRFFSIPLLLLLIVLVSEGKVRGWKSYSLVVLGFLFASGSYVTGTIFITMVIMLFLFGLFQQNKKRAFLTIAFYLILNSFWLLPFGNYTLQKSKIIRLAPNFISANEIQLNKNKEFYSPLKQLTLYHNFLDTKYTSLTDEKELFLHPIADVASSPFYLFVIGIFPVLYIAGSILVVVKAKRYRHILWIPAMVFLFLFLSLKEFSPLGFVYSFLNNLTPFFGVLFRFGDTKFHAYIVFGGSLLAGFFLTYLFAKISRKLFFWTFAAICISFSLFVYRDYFTGRFIGPFLMVSLPVEYEKLAEIINTDPSYSRILHVPFDREAYWKSYSWGAVGSAFLQYLIKSPLIDNTFEPGSMENASFDKQVSDLLFDFQLTSLGQREKRVAEFDALLKTAGVKYILLDGSIDRALYSRGMLLWGKFRIPDASLMLEEMTKFGMATVAKEYEIDLFSQAKEYPSWNTLSENQRELLERNRKVKLTLYEIQDVSPRVDFISEVTPTHSSLSAGIPVSDLHTIEAEGSGLYYPFKNRNNVFSETKDAFLSKLPLEKDGKVGIAIENSEPKENDKHYVSVFTRREGGSFVVSFYLQTSPFDVAGSVQKIKEFRIPESVVSATPFIATPISSYLSDWSILSMQEAGSFRLRVGNYILPLPSILSNQDQYVGTLAVSGSSNILELLAFSKRESANLQEFQLTDTPNCFGDKLEGGSYSISQNPTLTVSSKNQSTCLYYSMNSILADAPDHAEIHLNLTGSATDLDPLQKQAFGMSSKPSLKAVIAELPKPNTLRICLKEPTIDDCYNLHQFINVGRDTKVVIPSERAMQGLVRMDALLALKNTTYQKQEITVKELLVDQYRKVAQDSLNIPAGASYQYTADLKDLEMVIPKALSLYSFYFNPAKDSLYGENSPCDRKEGYRTFRLLDKSLISYLENCHVELFQETAFDSNNFYFWNVSYNLLSGKFPKFILKDKVHTYSDEYLSLYQGYPDIEGFKSFQNPQTFFTPLVQKAHLSGVPSQIAYGYIEPHFENEDFGKKQFIIHQDSENEGVMRIDSFSYQPLPNAWKNVSLQVGDSAESFSRPESYEFKQILPSLWKVTAEKASGRMLLKFNEGYDSQWRAYDSVWGVITGLGVQYRPIRCDSFANCFKVDSQKTYYIFYTPERLAMLGWVVTFGVIGAGYLLFVRSSKK